MLLEGKTAVITGCNQELPINFKKVQKIIVILLPAIKQIIMRVYYRL